MRARLQCAPGVPAELGPLGAWATRWGPRDRGHAIGATRPGPRVFGLRDRVLEIGATRSGPRGRGQAIGASRSGPRDRGHAIGATRPGHAIGPRDRGHGCEAIGDTRWGSGWGGDQGWDSRLETRLSRPDTRYAIGPRPPPPPLGELPPRLAKAHRRLCGAVPLFGAVPPCGDRTRRTLISSSSPSSSS